jgi:hypothetical protein
MKLPQLSLLILLFSLSLNASSKDLPLAEKLGSGAAQMIEMHNQNKEKYTYKSFDLVLTHGQSYGRNGCAVTDSSTLENEQTFWEPKKEVVVFEVISCELQLGFYQFCSASTRDNNGLFFNIKPPRMNSRKGWVVNAWINTGSTPKMSQGITINCVI